MGDKTGIEWTRSDDGSQGSTWNPVTGCDRTSPGCDHCYALTLAARLKAMGQPNYQHDGDPATSGPGFAVTMQPHMLDQPLRWTRPRRIFVNSMSDLFHPDVPVDYIAVVFAVMHLAPQHTFQVLTKRSKRMLDVLTDPTFPAQVTAATERLAATVAAGGLGPVAQRAVRASAMVWPLPNVWLGVTVESDRYSFRARDLAGAPAVVRFVSAEPLLSPVPSLDINLVDWVIAGGESGPGARPMLPVWATDLRDRCVAAGVPFFFKQWGDWSPEPGPDGSGEPMSVDDGFSEPVMMFRMHKSRTGRTLDGRTWSESPRVGTGAVSAEPPL